MGACINLALRVCAEGSRTIRGRYIDRKILAEAVSQGKRKDTVCRMVAEIANSHSDISRTAVGIRSIEVCNEVNK